MSKYTFKECLKAKPTSYATIVVTEIEKIRNPVVLGIYCYLKFCSGDIPIKDIQEHFKLPARHIESSLEFLRDEGLI